jgi:hypothetical protein
VDTLPLKLVLTPALIGAASVAGRRWGPAVSGWLVGFPFTSAPVALFLALGEGVGFAASAAVGTMVGTLSQAAFGIAYGWAARRRGWPVAALASCGAFAICTLALRPVALPLPPLAVLVAAGLTAALGLMPRRSRSPRPAIAVPPRWDLPARMVIATAFVLLLTAVASALGPRLTGLLSPFPLYAGILAVFAHRLDGADAAVAVLRGLLAGLFGFAGFFLALAAMLERGGIAAAFATAIAVTLVIQAAALRLLRRSRPRGAGARA